MHSGAQVTTPPCLHPGHALSSMNLHSRENQSPKVLHMVGGGRLSSGKYVETTCLRAAGSSPALIWRTESLDRGLILISGFSFVSSRSAYRLRLRPALVYKVMHVRNPLLFPNA
jgi:hypothetical protein